MLLSILFESMASNFNQSLAEVALNQDNDRLWQEYLQSGMRFEEFSRGEQFLHAEPRQITCFLERDELLVPSEDIVYYALRRWYDEEPRIRLQHFIEALPVVRLQLVPSYEFENVHEDIKSVRAALTENFRREATVYRQEFARHRALIANPRPRASQAVRKFLYVLGALWNERQSLQRYDFASGDWRAETDITDARKRAAVTVFNGCIWVAGGLTDGNEPLYSVCAYDPVRREWSPKMNMHEKRYGFGLAALDGKLYAVGGRNTYRVDPLNGIYSGPENLNTVGVYDGSAWTTGVAMNKARYALEVVVACGRVYAAGGWGTTENASLKSLEHYHPKTSCWTLILPPMRHVRKNFRIAAMGDIIYVVGGDRSHSIGEFNALYQRWIHRNFHLFSLPSTRDGLAATASDGLVYVLGGLHQNLETKSFEYVNIATGANGNLRDSPEAPGRDASAVVVTFPMHGPVPS